MLAAASPTASRTHFARLHITRNCRSTCPRSPSSPSPCNCTANNRVRSTTRPNRFVIVNNNDPNPVIKITGVIANWIIGSNDSDPISMPSTHRKRASPAT